MTDLMNPDTLADPIAPREASPIPPSAQQTRDLKQVIKYVEYYQPLYGLQIAPKPLRSCRDRAQVIAAQLTPLGPHLRIIDLGCSLGYFAFYFADRGVQAHGIDNLPQNIAVAEVVQSINNLPARFTCAELSLDFVRSLPAGHYDAALILSVLHHITHQHGLAYTRELLAELIERIPTLILELAHRNESVSFPWRQSQPEDPLEILSACRNIRTQKLGDFDTHLSNVRRPLWLITRNTP
jgi:SAM-dependent methyltransferase